MRTTYRLGWADKGGDPRAPSREEGLAQLTIPCLVAHGTHDPIPVQNACHTVAALQRQNKEEVGRVELMILPVEGITFHRKITTYVDAIHRTAAKAKNTENKSCDSSAPY